MRCSRVLESERSGMVDKAAYLQLYDEVLELRCELEKARTKTVSQTAVATTHAKDLGLTTQLSDLRDQVCEPSVRDSSFASPARVVGGNVPNPIRLSENKHLTDWSISLDQTNTSCCQMESDKVHCVTELDEECAHKPRASMSVGQQTEMPFYCLNCSTDTAVTQCGLVPLPESHPSAIGVNMISPASTLQELNVDFSESTTRPGVLPEYTESACSPIFDLMTQKSDAISECHLTVNPFWEQNHRLLDSLADAASACKDLQKRLSGVGSSAFQIDCNVKSTHTEDLTDFAAILQQIDAEVDRISDNFVELKGRLDSQPCYESEIIKLREKLEEAERLLEGRLSGYPQIATVKMREVLEAERKQLQQELNQRLADCSSTHATSVAELEQMQADLCARLSASEMRSNNLETERDAIVQKLNVTERFLNEQLQERDQEREEFQSEVGIMQNEIFALRNRLSTLERQQSQESSSASSSVVHTPVASPRKMVHQQGGMQTIATSTPTAHHRRPGTFTPSLLSVPDSSDHSDIDDSPTFELSSTPHSMLDRPSNLPTLNRRDWTRPYSAGDATLRKHTLPPVKLTTACVGNSPVELVNASISVQTSLSSSSSSTTMDLEAEDDDLVSTEDEIDDVQTKTTTSAALGVVTTTVTTTTKKRRKRLSRPCAMNTSEEANNIGLDVEMRHVAEMTKLREELEQAKSSVKKKNSESEYLEDQLNSTSQSPTYGHDKQLHSPSHMNLRESVHVQTLPNDPALDYGACWSCGRVSVNYVTTSVQTTRVSPRGSRESTLSPPPMVERSAASSASSNAEISISTPARTSSLTGDIESQLADEEELCEPLEQNISASEGDRLVADLEEARAEIEALKIENNGLISYQDDLHKDFELVQSMLEGRQSEVEQLQKELLEVPIRLQADFAATARDLRKIISDRYDVVEERDEDLFLLTEEKEALTNRVGELEKEVADLRDVVSSGRSREDTGSQTNPSHWTVESGIQVDLERSSLTSEIRSLANTDCASEEDLPFDGDFIMPSQTVADNSAAPPTINEALAFVDHQQQECCRLLSMSLAAAGSQVPDPNDYKSKLISRLIEANRTLKSVVETITKEDQGLQSSQTETAMTYESLTNATKGRDISNQLYASLLSALLADRKANLAFSILTTITQTSNAVSGKVPARPRSCESKAASQVTVHDVLTALDNYATVEEERWDVLFSAMARDRENVLMNVDSLKKSQGSLVNEVSHLTDQLAAKEVSLAEKSCIVKDLSTELKVLETTIAGLRAESAKAKAEMENQLASSRRQIDEARQHVAELESTLQASQHAIVQARENVTSLEGDLREATADLDLERNRLHLAEVRLVQLERENKTLKSSYVRIGPKANVNGNTHTLASSLKVKDSSIVNNAIKQLASARLRAIQAEKMSRELHACSQELRVSVAEAELSLLPMCLGKENGHLGGGGIGSGNTSGDDESPLSGEMIPRPLPKQLTDSGFADAPTGLRRLHLACSRLIHLASLATGDRTAPSPVASSSSSDSLNNPAELLRHAVLGGKKADFTDQPGVVDVYACLVEIESHVRSLVDGPAVRSQVTPTSTVTTKALVAQAKQLILSGVNYLDSNMGQIAAPLDNNLVCRRPSESRSSQCSLVNNSQSCGDSRTVSLEKFRHMSARYLRMESYRRALVYQKQYLLLLLGDFQYSMQRVTASLGQGLLMGNSSRLNVEGTSSSSSSSQHWPLNTPPALVRFRAAARCIMVIHRVKQLRLKWQRTGIRNHAPLFPHSTDSRTLGSGFSTVGSQPPTPLTVSNRQNGTLPEQKLSAVSLTTGPRSGLLDSRSDVSRRNHSTPSIAQPTCSAYPLGEKVDASNSYHQHYRVPTSSSSTGRFHWSPYRG